VEASGATTIITWWGKPGVKIVERAVWVKRGDDDAPPEIVTAAPASAPEAA
jgi:hypothetical protein